MIAQTKHQPQLGKLFHFERLDVALYWFNWRWLLNLTRDQSKKNSVSSPTSHVRNCSCVWQHKTWKHLKTQINGREMRQNCKNIYNNDFNTWKTMWNKHWFSRKNVVCTPVQRTARDRSTCTKWYTEVKMNNFYTTNDRVLPVSNHWCPSWPNI